MKYLLIILNTLTFFCIGLNCVAQDREIGNARKTGKFTYEVEFKNDYKEKKILKSLSKSGYRLIDSKLGSVKTYGEVTEGIKYIEFVKEDEYYAYQQSQIKPKSNSRKTTRSTSSEMDVSDYAAIAIALGLGYTIVSEGVKFFADASSSSNGSVSNSNVEIELADKWESDLVAGLTNSGVKTLKATLTCGNKYLSTSEITYYPSSSKKYSLGLVQNYETLADALVALKEQYQDYCP